jgi:Rrf2 family protein
MSEGVEWGLHCCGFLSNLREDETMAGKDLAEFFGLPPAYLLKNLRALARAGVLRTTSGPRGGYRLARPPEEITLLDIVEALEGSEPAYHCSEIRQRGPSALDRSAYPQPCGVAVAMWRAEEAWRDSLRATTIADLEELGRHEVPREQRAKASEWLGLVRARRG